MIILTGISAFNNMPRQEDPGFVIRVAQVMTILPGASPERMENLVTDPIEEVVQQMPELDMVFSESLTGLSLVYVNIKKNYKDMRPIWDNLRRKVEAASADLPQNVIGPIVNDEFGDVFGIMLTLTGEGYSYAELKEVADQVRNELLHIPDVAKVEIYGAQEERIFIEYSNARLAQLGLSPYLLNQILSSQNILFPGGNISTGDERIELEPTGNFETIEELQKIVLGLPGSGEMVYLGDIASVRRGYVDPPRSKMRSSGIPALGIGISVREGGNIINLGEAVRSKIKYLQEKYPIGIEFDEIAFQPDKVRNSVNDFLNNLMQAVGLVILVMLIALGLRTGFVVATLIPVTIMMTFMLMRAFGMTINTMSLASLMIALGMLVDNAIVMSESILVSIKEGKKPVKAAVDSAKELNAPLLIASLTTAAAFLPIALAESETGEYCIDLFKVITIALVSSWILSLTMIPMLCAMFLKVKKQDKEESYNTKFYNWYKGFLTAALKHRWISLLITFIIFISAMQLSKVVPSLFFPASDRPFLFATLEFPVGSPIQRTEEMVNDLEQFFTDSLLIGEDRPEGIKNWASFIGRGAPRYVLATNPQPEKEGLAYLLINSTSRPIADDMVPRIEKYLWDRYPDLSVLVLPLDYGPPVEAPVQVRLSGADPDLLFTMVEELKAKMKEIPGTRNITDNWGNRVKKLMVNIDQPRARRAGVSSFDIALSLQTILSGYTISEFRESEDVIPVVMRAEASDRQDIAKLETLDVFAQATGKTVPLSQVADIEVVWQPSKILRRDRMKTVTVSCYTKTGTMAMDIVNALRPYLDEKSKEWQLGYFYEFGGELESSVDAQKSISDKLGIAFIIIILLLVIQFNSLRKPLIILLTIPLALIGVYIGLFVLRGMMGFMTFLGVIALAGIVINNAIVLLDRIKLEQEENGLEPFQAIIVASMRRLRPIILTTLTTIGGMIPLWLGGGPMWESMAIALMSGLLFSTGLTLVVVPVLYSLFYRVKFG